MYLSAVKDTDMDEDFDAVYINTETLQKNGHHDNIYESLHLNAGVLNTGVKKEKKRTPPKRLFLATLGLLYVLLIVGIIVIHTIEAFSSNFTAQRDGFLTSYQNLTQERDRLLVQAGKLGEEKQSLAEKLEELQCNYTRLLLKDSEKWQRHLSSEYYVASGFKDWSESRKDCKDRGADLVIVNSWEEQVFLNSLKRDSETFWIGLSDLDIEGQWRWVDNTALSEKYWRKGEPNDIGKNEDCAVFNSSPLGLPSWNDQPCSIAINWICERELRRDTAVECNSD
ncbi:C-type lectin domain family 4 member E-like [Chanos chanos]|uniref:C-type lectin domain family 4 member E-like n=1 Tax=Chanos chanos TaxID=29144 RepID=A0A6J2WHC4_CHACN|nr:C-type lectin domain family 4 member E-like [Chanos chanos]